MGALHFHARLNLCSGVGVATASLARCAMEIFAIKKAPPPAVAEDGAVYKSETWGCVRLLNGSLRGHDTLKAGDVLAEPLTGASS